ncbi:hypothetical protein BT67DRAFT_435244 [Trichocladium antarcticum]|uniref:Uncharacterized protein n=1 Tax=Trichocladium antarcticum TaxID=1450529 RepID=A0AAN6ZC94_9PEZI|nr:hypothetical protein BT67DRAFT_435244 [Trichocladium antarcticum]
MDDERTITLDLGSSPDPLIDPILSPPMVPPSTVKPRSTAAQRLYTLATSPRKRTFELDVGNERSPQRLRVTVEADGDETRSTNRRLFQSPTPKRRASPAKTTVTTTVPLRGLSDDETPAATPRRRGRPRKSGTPITTRRKRPGTPAKGRGSGAHAFLSPQKDILTSDINEDATPRPSAQPRRVAKRKPTSPAKEDGAPGSQPRKRGRPRKQPLALDDSTARPAQGATAGPTPGANVSMAPTRDGLSDARIQPSDGMEDDIWLATLSDQPTPVAREPAVPARGYSPEPQQYDWPDMGGGMDSHSEAESLTSDYLDDQDRQDTVMAGEEFTMIDFHSLLSMQPNTSMMAPEPQQLDEDANLIINRTLEDLRQSLNKPAEGGNTADPPVTAPETGENANAREGGIQQRADQSLPPPPPKSPQTWNRSPRRAKAQPLAKQLALKKALQQDDGPSPAPRPPTLDDALPQDASAYDDSFSEIPEAVLAAATPRRVRQPQAEEERSADEDIQPSIERPSRVNHFNPQSETNRLLTPDETPSPSPSDTNEDDAQPNSPRPAQDFDMHSSPPIGSAVAQQPPIAFMAQHIRANSTETPAEQLASLAPLTSAGRDALPAHLPVPESQPRPSLSPIVRIGRALQLVTSDPPSPPARESFLGSPFRGSATKSSQSPAPVPAAVPVQSSKRATQSPSPAPAPPPPRAGVMAEPPQRSWLAPIKDFVVRSAQSLSPSRVSVSGTERMDDPFGPDPAESTSFGSVRSNLFSGLNRRAHDRDATVSLASSTGAASAHGDDAMSWQPEEGSPAGGSRRPASPSSDIFAPREAPRGGQDLTGAQTGPAQEREHPTVEAPQPEATPSEPEQDDGGDGGYEDDEDIWAFEAERPTPYTAKTVQLRQEAEPEGPQRSQVPSPWRQTSRHLVYSDELLQQSSDNAGPVESEGPTNEDDEFSMLAQTRKERVRPIANPPTKKPDLAAFFSSPALLPDMPELPSIGLSRAFGSRRAEQRIPAAEKPQPAPVVQRPASGTSLSAHYLQPETQPQLPSIPQKHLEIGGRQRSVDLFSPARKTAERSTAWKAPAARAPRSSSPETRGEIIPAYTSQRPGFNPRQRESRSAVETVAAPARQSVSLDTPAEEARPRHIPQKMTFGLGQQQADSAVRTTDAQAQRPAPPDVPEEVRPAHIPQKMNFSPRQRQSSDGRLFQPSPVAPAHSLFRNPLVSAFFSPARPRQTRPRARVREVTPEEGAFTLADLPQNSPPPNRAVSPGKSCMRSPLKPKTPGRVVDFTSSTLSPLAQAQARAERRASNSPEKLRDHRSQRLTSSSTTQNAPVAVQEAEDKENSDEPPEPAEEDGEEPPGLPGLNPVPFTSTSTSLTRPATTTTTTKRNPPPPLSPTHWSRPHWLRLDELLQARKQGALHFQRHLSRHNIPNNNSRRRQTRQQLVGKLVTSQGEAMPLEGWHLDVAEAFRAEVGGQGVWDEAQIAKRVFALLVGEERRRRGLVRDRGVGRERGRGRDRERGRERGDDVMI